jgi:hypothetical protein
MVYHHPGGFNPQKSLCSLLPRLSLQGWLAVVIPMEQWHLQLMADTQQLTASIILGSIYMFI